MTAAGLIGVAGAGVLLGGVLGALGHVWANILFDHHFDGHDVLRTWKRTIPAGAVGLPLFVLAMIFLNTITLF